MTKLAPFFLLTAIVLTFGTNGWAVDRVRIDCPTNVAFTDKNAPTSTVSGTSSIGENTLIFKSSPQAPIPTTQKIPQTLLIVHRGTHAYLGCIYDDNINPMINIEADVPAEYDNCQFYNDYHEHYFLCETNLQK